MSISDVGINSTFDGIADVIFICSKAGDVSDLFKVAKRLCHKETKILVLSNGLGHLELGIEEFGAHRMIPATTTHGAWRKNPGNIVWAGLGSINLGQIGNSPSFEEMTELFSLLEKSGLNPNWIEDGKKLIWSKVLINIAINPIAAITGQLNGDLLESEIFETCAEVMIEGARAVSYTHLRAHETV